MKSNALRSRLFVIVVAVAFSLAAFKTSSVFAQARRQPPPSDQKKNKRPPEGQQTEEQKQEPLPPDLTGKPQEAEKVTIVTNIVNVDAVVYNKKSGQIITGLKKDNFAIFVDGVKKDITNFATPEAPITITLVVEFSKLGETLGLYGSRGMEPGQLEVIRPMAMFLSQFITPQDYASVIAYDMRPTPITDFTNNPQRIQQVITFLLRNTPAFTETNLFDALKLTLVGGRADSVALEDSKEAKSDYAGMVAVPGGRRRAVLLISSGLDTFSKINHDQARKIVQNAGIPIYIVGTGNMFMKLYGDQLDPGRGTNIRGIPIDRMTFLQADNTLNTFAKETGGAYYPVTFEGELPNVLQSINALLRSQYSLAFKPDDAHDGKQHKIVVKVDVDGDGQYDDKAYVVKAREIYNSPKDAATPGSKQ
ncbi:MAG TPA: VWA domain-containing protein [Pyrinomonadaceae bacterium]|nr:VWA domain-containing protein [Pyrinomonadaceae bacterium]